MRPIIPVLSLALVLLTLALGGASAGASELRLTETLGRSDVRVLSSRYELTPGTTVAALGLEDRLEALGYRRVRRKPTEVGQFFWGYEVFWIYQRADPYASRNRQARLIGLELRRSDGRIEGFLDATGTPLAIDSWSLEAEVLAESLAGDRAPRHRLRFADLPERAWRPLLAAEDARFFTHRGLDGRSIARAALANVKAGGVAQGGSTITQQLIKMRDLTPKRSLGRKVSEAVRSLTLEAEYDKEEILEAYLDHVYLGHVDGLALHGWGAGARAYFSKPPEELDWAESALLAAIVQGPNRLSPRRHPERARARRDWVLSRLAELEWAPSQEIARAKARGLGLRPSSPPRRSASHFVRWVGEVARESAAGRLEKGRGVVVSTTLDPQLQRLAEGAVRDGLSRLKRQRRRLRNRPLSAALVALDVRDGRVLAYVAGDPDREEDRFDRVRQAQRQPGSTVKPLLLLEAFERCGERRPLYPAARIADEPLTLDLPSGSWRPVNNDGEFRGVVSLRHALSSSLNVPFARIAGWCGLGPTAARMRKSGLALPAEPPPSFALGAVETSPLRLAEAFTVFATPGQALRPFPVESLERPGGRRLGRSLLARSGRAARRVVRPASAYLVRDMMRTAAREGTARGGAVAGFDVAGKTGTSSDGRDAWFAGDAGSMVVVVWVGVDDNSRAGLSGAAAAAPIWQSFVASAAGSLAPRQVEAPRAVEQHYYDPKTGRRVRAERRGAEAELFRRGALPPHKRIFRRDPPLPVVR
ncbi:MAG: transglycosylase domain-containing protein [Acidobacteriota bacterium]